MQHLDQVFSELVAAAYHGNEAARMKAIEMLEKHDAAVRAEEREQAAKMADEVAHDRAESLIAELDRREDQEAMTFTKERIAELRALIASRTKPGPYWACDVTYREALPDALDEIESLQAQLDLRNKIAQGVLAIPPPDSLEQIIHERGPTTPKP